MVIICHHGIRSLQAADYLRQQGFRYVVNLTGGVAAWASDCDLTMPRY
jgi:rhodanese-related sulfurtransferase